MGGPNHHAVKSKHFTQKKTQNGQRIDDLRRAIAQSKAKQKEIRCCCSPIVFKHLSNKQMAILALTLSAALIGMALVTQNQSRASNLTSKKSTSLSFFEKEIELAFPVKLGKCVPIERSTNQVQYCQLLDNPGRAVFIKQYTMPVDDKSQNHRSLQEDYRSYTLETIFLGERLNAPLTQEKSSQLLTAALTHVSKTNFNLLKLLGIRVPTPTLIRSGSTLFSAFNEITNFLTADKIFNSEEFYRYLQAKQGQGSTETESMLMFIVDVLGEEEFAKLFVASSFINNIWNNPTNWGVISDDGGVTYKLAIVDADWGILPKETRYYEKNIEAFKETLFEQNFLTLSFLKKIRNHFKTLQKNLLPQEESALGIPQELYQSLLETYVKIFSTAYKELNNSENKPSGKKIGGRLLSKWQEAIDLAEQNEWSAAARP